MTPSGATADTFIFTDTDGRVYSVKHGLDIPLPRSTMTNITLTPEPDGSAVYAWDYMLSQDTGEIDGNGEPIWETVPASDSYTVDAETMTGLTPEPEPIPESVPMVYVPFNTIAEAYGWSHEKECDKVWDEWEPRNMRDTPYLYRVLEHPTKDEALVALPESQADPESTTLDADELANLLDTLPAEYEPEAEA